MEIEKEPKVSPDPGQNKQEQQQESKEPTMERVEGVEILPGEGESAKLRVGKLQIEIPIIFERYNEMGDGAKTASRKIGEHVPEGLPSPPVPENGIYRHGKHLMQVVESNNAGIESSLVRVIELPENVEYID